MSEELNQNPVTPEGQEAGFEAEPLKEGEEPANVDTPVSTPAEEGSEAPAGEPEATPAAQ